MIDEIEKLREEGLSGLCFPTAYSFITGRSVREVITQIRDTASPSSISLFNDRGVYLQEIDKFMKNQDLRWKRLKKFKNDSATVVVKALTRKNFQAILYVTIPWGTPGHPNHALAVKDKRVFNLHNDINYCYSTVESFDYDFPVCFVDIVSPAREYRFKDSVHCTTRKLLRENNLTSISTP